MIIHAISVNKRQKEDINMGKFSKFYILLAAVALWGCSTADDSPLSSDRTWEASLMASKLDIQIQNLEDSTDNAEETTRSLFVGGQSGTNFIKLWDNSDVVQVYKAGTYVGTLVPDNKGNQRSTLSGTLTGDFAEGDELTLYMPSGDLNYTGQDGTIGTMSSYFDFMKTTAKVASVEDGKVTTDAIKFESVQAYMLLKFKDEDGKLLHIKEVQIMAKNAKLVTQQPMNGTPSYTSTLTIITPHVNSQIDDYPTEVYVAIKNDYTKKETYAFTVIATDGKTYKSISNVSTTLSVGALGTANIAVRCSNPDIQTQTAITPPESDDPDVQQVTL